MNLKLLSMRLRLLLSLLWIRAPRVLIWNQVKLIIGMNDSSRQTRAWRRAGHSDEQISAMWMVWAEHQLQEDER